MIPQTPTVQKPAGSSRKLGGGSMGYRAWTPTVEQLGAANAQKRQANLAGVPGWESNTWAGGGGGGQPPPTYGWPGTDYAPGYGPGGQQPQGGGQQPMGGQPPSQAGGYPLNDPRNPLTAGGRGNVQAAGGWQNLMEQQGYPVGSAQGVPGGQQGVPGAPPVLGDMPGGGVPGAPAGTATGIQTSITPQPMFSQDFTQAQGNLQTAMATPTRSGLSGLQGARGLSSLQSPAIQQDMANQWGQQTAGAQMLGPQVAQQHQMANIQQMLQGQQAREGEAQGWAGQSIQQQASNDQLNRMQQQTVLQMLLGQNPWWT